MQEVNDVDFEDVVVAGSKESVVIVDYYSDSCVPCKNLLPKLTNALNNTTTTGKIVKVNVEHNLESSIRNKVRTIPTLIVYKNGIITQELRGCSQLSESAIEELLGS